MDTTKSDLVTNEDTKPLKKISEQYSSPEQTPIATTENDSSKKIEYKEEEIIEEQKEEEVQKIVNKPAEAIANNQIKESSKKKAKKRFPEIEFETHLYDFGEIMQGDKIETKFIFKNTGTAPLTITKADATCGCAAPSIPFMDIMPGEKGYIGILYNSVGKEGEEYPEVTIFSNAKTYPNQVLKLQGFVKVPEKEEEKTDSLKTTPIDTTDVDNF